MISEYAKQEIEKFRTKSLLYKRLNKVTGAGIFLVAFALFGGVFWLSSKGEKAEIVMPFFFIAIFAIIILGNIMQKKAAQYRQDFQSVYKRQFVRGILDTQLDNVDYVENQGYTRQEIHDFQLVFLSNSVSSEDYLRAVYNGVAFEQADVKIIHRRSKKADEVYFKGRILKLPYSKKQVEDIQIFTRNFRHRASSVTGQVMVYGGVVAAEADTPGITRTEDVEFNKQFDVYSANNEEAFYLLTPQFMETLKRLASRYPYIGFHFKGNEVYVAIGSQRDTFECSVDKPIVYEEEEKRIIADIDEIKVLIDTLQLQRN